MYCLLFCPFPVVLYCPLLFCVNIIPLDTTNSMTYFEFIHSLVKKEKKMIKGKECDFY